MFRIQRMQESTVCHSVLSRIPPKKIKNIEQICKIIVKNTKLILFSSFILALHQLVI